MSVQALDARKGWASRNQSRTAAGELAPVGVGRDRVFRRFGSSCPLAPRLGQASSFPMPAWFPSLCRRSVPLPPEKRAAASWLRNHAVGGRLMSIPASPPTAENRVDGRPVLALRFGAMFPVTDLARVPSHRRGPNRRAGTSIAPNAPNRPQVARLRAAPVPTVAKKSVGHRPGASGARAVHLLARVRA